MDIKIPRIRFIRPQHIDTVSDDIIKLCLKHSVWLAFIGLWQIFQWVKQIYDLIKPLIEGMK